MGGCIHPEGSPAAFELLIGRHTMRYAGTDGVIAAASTFGGRWRVTTPSGEPLFSLAPVGAPGTDDREVVPQDSPPVATVMRDRRRRDSWVVLEPGGGLMLRATADGPYVLTLKDRDGAPAGRIFATATSVVMETDTGSAPTHCVALALPLFFATTGALAVDQLDAPSPDLALWNP